MSTIKKTSLFFSSTFLIIIGYSTYHLLSKLPIDELHLQEKKFIQIKSVLEVKTSVSSQLKEQGIPSPKWLIQTILYASSFYQKPKAGYFEVNEKTHLYELLLNIILDNGIKYKIYFPEGSSLKEIRKIVDSNPNLIHLTKNFSDKKIALELGSNPNLEGLLFPSTYIFQPATDDLAIYKQAYALMKKYLNEVWSSRDKSITLKNSYEALILASIIEKETGIYDSPYRISSVFNNRLKYHMKLQSDPTVIYGMDSNFDGNLRKKDLTNRTPYNTYVLKGLPPTPISSPGLKSLKAAMNPEKTNFLYFVSKGDGSSFFSEDLSKHNTAVNNFQKKREK